MKRLILLLIPLIFTTCEKIVTENEIVEKENSEIVESELEYDSLLAQKYGADDYGMKLYIMAFLYSGNNKDLTKQESDSLQAKHMENIGALAESGKLLLAGPFGRDSDLRGIYIFDVRTIEEAEALTNTDPAIQAGVLRMELKEWYGSAAVMAINDIHNTIQKISF